MRALQNVGVSRFIWALCGFLFTSTSTLNASIVTDFAVFGDRMVMAGGSLGGPNNDVGPIGSNGGVSITNNGNTTSISGGGVFQIGGSPDVIGDVLFNGDATFGNNAVVVGNINSGGNVKFGGSANVTGNIRAGGNVQFGNNGDVMGSIDAGGNGSFGSNNDISGHLTLGGTISAGSPNVAGTTTQNGSPAAPALFSSVSVPGASAFVAGVANHTVGNNAVISLAPGSYGNITLGGSSELKLMSPGTYIFNSLTAGSNLDILLDLADGLFKIFVANSVNIGGSVSFVDLSSATQLNPFSGSTPTSDADLAKHLYLEVAANFQAGNNAQWFGTIFAPDGDITFAGSADVAGALYAGNSNGDASGGTVKFTNNALMTNREFDMLPSQFFPVTETSAAPEMASVIVWTFLIGLCGATGSRRRKKTA